ncbi:hypothetical protein SAMN02983003_1601 [Devosia enhydra]|uniref:Uncharacterized protein n=1 Tax=Devosia enhydra TaxID=665118 RepID=A0A1K2HWG8_9HYPH|nr:hypothetical protein [Devosia enhydra]SFZ83361.1 hypothetical protein SAMN02983003_1601 [Devosia enhydra]
MTEPSFPILVETALPGSDNWPSGTVALGRGDWTTNLGEDLIALCARLEAALAPCEPADRLARLEAELAGDDAGRAALQKALFTAYYTAPETVAATARAAEAGPDDPDPLFDPALVANVVREGRGRMRRIS